MAESAQTSPGESSNQDPAFIAEFEELAGEWRQGVSVQSSARLIVEHDAYQKIIGLGQPAVPLILGELKERPALWFWALTAITGEDPAVGETTIDGAAQRWFEWADERGIEI